MKFINKSFLTAVLVFVSTTTIQASDSSACKNQISVPYVHCSTELPLIYSDQFNKFNHIYWSTENGKAMVKNGWIHIKHDTFTSMDHTDQHLNNFRILLRFQAGKMQQNEFSITFATGEELIFSNKTVTVQKRKRQITQKWFSATAWPQIAEDPIPLYLPGKWNTLLVDYDSDTGLVSLDTNNDCAFDYVFEWVPKLQFSHISGYKQKWDFFELYASKEQKTEEQSGVPVYQLEWSGFGDDARGIAVDGNNHVYVSSPFDKSVKIFDSTGNLLAEWPDFIGPQGIAVDKDNFIYIADSGSNTIKKYDTAGVMISELPSYGDEYGSLSYLHDVAVDEQGIVYVPSFNMWFGSKILKFTTDWVFISEISLGTDSIVTGLDVDSVGNIYLTSSSGIQKYDSNGNYIMAIGTVSGGNSDGDFSQGSYDIFINDNDLLFATDGGDNNRVQVFNTNGDFLYNWGTEGSGNGEFEELSRISAASDSIFILDTGNNRVQKFK